MAAEMGRSLPSAAVHGEYFGAIHRHPIAVPVGLEQHDLGLLPLGQRAGEAHGPRAVLLLLGPCALRGGTILS